MTREQDEARTRRAKGSVQEAIGKIIGNPTVEKHGLRERKAGTEQAEQPVDHARDDHAGGHDTGDHDAGHGDSTD